MDSLMHADIFFFVTTIAVVVIAVLVVAILIYIVLILRRARKLLDDVRGIAKEVKDEAVLIREDIRGARAKVATGLKLKNIFDFVSGIVQRQKAKGQSRRKTKG